MVCYGEPGANDPGALGEPGSDKGYYVALSFVENKRVSLRRVLRGGRIWLEWGSNVAFRVQNDGRSEDWASEDSAAHACACVSLEPGRPGPVAPSGERRTYIKVYQHFRTIFRVLK